MKIAFATHDYVKNELLGPDPRLGGTGLMRVQIPAKGLADFGGHHVMAVPISREFLRSRKDGGIEVTDFDGVAHDDVDVVVFQRWMSDEAPGIIRKAKAAGQTIVNDIDDWFQGLTQRNGAFINTHPKTDPRFNRNHYHKAIAASSLIVASTPYLADRYKSFGVPTVVLRNAIDADMWPWHRDPAPVLDSRLTLGWVGSTPQRAGADLAKVRGVLPGFLEKHGVGFHHSGAIFNAPEAATELGIDASKVPVSFTPLTLIDSYPRAFGHFDIGIAPLDDIPFNRAKSWLKSLEYAAAGIPHVATDLPEYRELGAALLADKPNRWRAALGVLLDPGARDDLRENGYVIAREQTIQKRWQEWEEAFASI